MATFNVSNGTELKSAITSALGGDRIVLADGDYGKVYVTNRAFASAVTIEAATPGTGAHLDGLFVAGTKNLNVVGLDIGRALNAGEPPYTQLSSISNSTNIKLSGVTIHGSLDGNPGNDGAGLTVTGVTGFSVSGSHFEELYRGIVLQKSTNSAIHDNEITMMRSDGIISVANDGLSIEGNHIGEFRPAIGDHADAIQFWNTGQTRGQSNITIKDNVIYQSFTSDVAGTGMQGIFISDPLTYGYKNVLIQNNLLYCNDLYNGIFLNGASGAQIIDNTVVSKSTDGKNFWINLMNSDHVSLVHNISDKIIVASNVTDFTQDGNVSFTTDKTARALLPNLNNPTGVHDLVADGVGYQLPSETPAAIAPPAPAVLPSIDVAIEEPPAASAGADGQAGLVLKAPASAYSISKIGETVVLASKGETHLVKAGETIRFADHSASAAELLASAKPFDALAYTASYADLRAAFGTNAELAARHYLDSGFSEGRTVSFDGLKYIASYSDLIGAFGANGTSGTEHYIRFGAAEGRTASFDALRYTASYSDLIHAFGTDQTAATEHYIRFGAAEGRTASFDALRYTASYSDLIHAFRTDQGAATEHYIRFGAAEGRTATFDALRYTASYSDLIHAFGTDQAGATRHFINFGADEGRKTTFDPVGYLLSYDDLESAGLGAEGALRHWINYGLGEHRSGDRLFGHDQISHVARPGSTADVLQSDGDHDWFAVQLKAGQGAHFQLETGSFAGHIEIHDSAGHLLAQDSAPIGDAAAVDFAASSSDTYYVVAASHAGAGSFMLSFEPM